MLEYSVRLPPNLPTSQRNAHQAVVSYSSRVSSAEKPSLLQCSVFTISFHRSILFLLSVTDQIHLVLVFLFSVFFHGFIFAAAFLRIPLVFHIHIWAG